MSEQFQYLKVRPKDKTQNIILLKENGEQLAATLECYIVIRPQVSKIQFPRTVSDGQNDYRLIKYSEKQDIVFYKLVKQ